MSIPFFTKMGCCSIMLIFPIMILLVVCLAAYPSAAEATQLCHKEERMALLQFMQLFSINCSATSSFCYEYDRPSTPPNRDNWKEGTDCCGWYGVECDNVTGHVIGLHLYQSCLYGNIPPNSTLFNLVHLQELDLSCNNFSYSPISLTSFGRHFPNLTLLELSFSEISGQILPSEEEEEDQLLVSQGVAVNATTANASIDFQLPTKLQILRLRGNRRLTGKLPSFNGATQLRVLDLFLCSFSGAIPTSLGNLTKLRELRLGLNSLNGQLLLPSTISQLKDLEVLILSNCSFSGSILKSLGNLTKLRVLNLGWNNLNGQFPSSTIGQLKDLEYLYLYNCNFSGAIPTSLGNNLTQLTYLELSDNHFSGELPSSLSELAHLSILGLSDNHFRGELPSSFSNLSQLYSIDFSNNQLTGTFPSSFFNISSLSDLSLSSNNLRGTIDLDMFAKLETLYSLDLSNSGLSLTTTNSTPYSFPNLETLELSSCNITINIPAFLNSTQQNLLYILDISNNNIVGQLHPSICNHHDLQYLDLSNNQFFGFIPDCLGISSDQLSFLKLSKNNFNGTVPQVLFGHGSMLQALDISYNKLQGVLPRSLANCKNLEILNVGRNLIVDVFPSWMEHLLELKVLILRDNRFHGPIAQPRNRSHAFTNLHIIDVSHNSFTGNLPSKYFESWDSMTTIDEDASKLKYMTDINTARFYSVTIINKGLEMIFLKVITTLKVVDLSNNKFHGQIPISIGRLKMIQVLNFSRNGLSGPIPLSLANLTNLESLDLSRNKLSGMIPQDLVSLTFLEVLDVSQNNLAGFIPQGGQFDTFLNTSYEGNPGLCGLPLSNKCGNVMVPESPTFPSPLARNFKFNIDGVGWEVVLLGYACGAVFGLVIGSCIIRRKEDWLVKIFGVKMRQPRKRS